MIILKNIKYIKFIYLYIPKNELESFSSWIKRSDNLICEWFYRMIKNMEDLI